jgi:hypothetical protein
VTFRGQEAQDYSGEWHLEHNNEDRETEIYPFVRPVEAFNTYTKKLKPSTGYVEYTVYNYKLILIVNFGGRRGNRRASIYGIILY